MSYLKYRCKNAACRINGKALVWYVANDGTYHKTNFRTAPDVDCKKCGTPMSVLALQQSRPKEGRDLNSGIADRLKPMRERRATAVAQERGLRRRLEREKEDSDNDELVDAGAMEETAEDPNFLLPAQFNPNMRFTAGPARRTCRVAGSYPINLAYLKVISQQTIDEAQHRPDSTSSVMGAAISGSGTLSAWMHAGFTDYTVDKFTSAEWCHLWADCLGGPTVAGNLVAASYCANTEMLVIEHKIKGKRQFKITVIADCSAEHVAEMITYQIHSTKPGVRPNFIRRIDAKNHAFTKADADDLRRELDAWLRRQT